MTDSTAIEPSGPVAWSDPSTRRSIWSYRVKGWITAVVGCALLTVAVSIASSATDRTDELEEIGTRTDGIVVDVSSGFRSEGHIDVRFTAAGEEQLRQINLNSDSPRYSVGDEVTVIYDPGNLSNLRTDVEENDSGWSVLSFCITFVGSILCLPGGLVMARRAKRWAWMARGGQWRRERIEYTSIPHFNSVQPLVKYRPDSVEPVVRGLTGTARWRLRNLREENEVWVLGDVNGRALLATPGLSVLFETRPPRTERGRRRWHEAFEPGLPYS